MNLDDCSKADGDKDGSSDDRGDGYYCNHNNSAMMVAMTSSMTTSIAFSILL